MINGHLERWARRVMWTLLVQPVVEVLGRSIKSWGLVAGTELCFLGSLHPEALHRAMSFGVGLLIAGGTLSAIVRPGFFD